MIAPTSPADILRAARELISTPERWTQDAFARSLKRRPVKICGKSAVCFCSMGAIEAVAQNQASPAAGAREYLRTAIGQGLISTWNDDRARTHADILAGFDRAIALAEQANP